MNWYASMWEQTPTPSNRSLQLSDRPLLPFYLLPAPAPAFPLVLPRSSAPSGYLLLTPQYLNRQHHHRYCCCFTHRGSSTIVLRKKLKTQAPTTFFSQILVSQYSRVDDCYWSGQTSLAQTIRSLITADATENKAQARRCNVHVVLTDSYCLRWLLFLRAKPVQEQVVLLLVVLVRMLLSQFLNCCVRATLNQGLMRVVRD